MRIHLSLAALILISGIVAGWWFERSPSGPHDVVEMRNAIAGGNAVVATYSRQGNGGAPAAIITFIRGKGWMWEVPPKDTNAGSLVISSSSEMLAAAAPGCYIAIQDLPAPVVPGVNLASDLGHAPGLKITGDVYSYTFGADDDDDSGDLLVSENLSAVATTQSYTARLSLDGHAAEGQTLTANPGTYTIRRATDSERQAAERLLTEATASPVAAFTMEQRAVVPGLAPQVGAIQMVSPKACPAAVVLNPAVLGNSPDISVFTRTNTKAILGAPLETDAGRVAALSVLPVDLPITASSDELLSALSNVSPQNLPLAMGATFGLPFDASKGEQAVVMAISACQPEPWFPC